MKNKTKIIFAFLFSVFLISFASAADPGHSSSVIGPGTFETGNYIFPNNLTVNGFVGIGLNPSIKFHVNGSARFDRAADGRVQAYIGTVSGENTYFVRDDGNFGIGTTTPGSKLSIVDGGAGGINFSVQSSTSPFIQLVKANIGNYYGIEFLQAGTQRWNLGYEGGFGNGGEFGISESDQNYRLVIQNGTGNIGIGTTTPSKLLDVRGEGNFSGTIFLNNTNNIVTNLTSLWGAISGVNSSSSSSDDWNQSGAYVFPKDLNYSVGIGTATPGAGLQVNNIGGNANVSIQTSYGGNSLYLITKSIPSGFNPLVRTGDSAIIFTNGTQTSGSGAFFIGPWSSVRTGIRQTYNATEINGNFNVTSTSGTLGLYQDNSANVGIGTATPGKKLEVFSTSASDGISLNSTNIDGPNLEFRSNATTHWNLDQYGAEGDLRFFKENSGDGSGTVLLTLKHDGNVTLNSKYITGLASPLVSTDAATKGYVDAINTSSSAADDWNVSGSNLFPKSLAYNVGIGTSSPTGSLSIDGLSNTNLLKLETALSTATLINVTVAGAERATFTKDANGNLVWATVATRHFSINPGAGGNVGIGTSTPSRTLDVRGEGNFSGTIFLNNTNNIVTNLTSLWSALNGVNSSSSSSDDWNVSGINLFPKDLTYNVGIGTTAPQHKLNVVGGIGLDSSAAGGSYIQFNDSLSTQRWRLQQGISGVTDNSFALYHDNSGTITYPMVVTFSDNIGLGTRNPVSLVNINGSAPSGNTGVLTIHSPYGQLAFNDTDDNTFSQFSFSGGALAYRVASASATPYLWIASDGKTGLGTSTPSRTLDVRGEGNFSGTIFLNNTNNIVTNLTTIVNNAQANATSLSYLYGQNSSLWTEAWKSYNVTYNDFWRSNSTIWSAINSVNSSSSTADDWNVSGNYLFPKSLDYRLGVGIATPGASLDVEGRTSQFSNTGIVYRYAYSSEADTNWKGIANITMGAGIYEAVSFEIKITDAMSNYGASADARPMTYYVSMRGNDAGNYSNVSGPFADYIRSVKTAAGKYELQFRQPVTYRHTQVEVQQISTCCGTVTVSYVDSPTNGSITGIVYNATQINTNYFSNVGVAGILNVSNNLYVNSTSVGIGTSVPTQTLDVRGAGNFSGTVYIAGRNDLNLNLTYLWGQNASLWTEAWKSYNVTYNDFWRSNSTIWSAINAGTSTYNSSYVPYTGATSAVNLGANNLTVDTSVFHVDINNDRVGIGTKLPGAKLEVNGSLRITFNNSLTFARDIAGSDYSTFIDATNYPSAGYGGADQNYWLRLSSKGGTHVVLNTDGSVGAVENAYDHFVIWQSKVDGDKVFDVSNIGKVFVNNSLGIGTTPSYPLHVSGASRVGSIGVNANPDATYELDVGGEGRVQGQFVAYNSLFVNNGYVGINNNQNTYGLQVSAGGTNANLKVDGNAYIDGNVGIATTAPAHTLEVKGTFNASTTNGGARLTSTGDFVIGI